MFRKTQFNLEEFKILYKRTATGFRQCIKRNFYDVYFIIFVYILGFYFEILQLKDKIFIYYS